MKFNSQCKTAQKFKAAADSPEAVEWFKNIHIPNCHKCSRRARILATPKVTGKGLVWNDQELTWQFALPSGAGDRFTIRSFTDPKKSYVVTKKGAAFRCSCPRWIFSKHKTDCKHIEQIKLKKAA